MKPTTLLAALFLLGLSNSSRSQEYSYTHYDISDGLAGSTVYCITQDKDGFIWMGTETGVSRFDGTHFHNYTAADGLPDVEILDMFTDSKGRVWMAPFQKSVCYYFKGKIYNQQNDTLLSKLRFNSYIDRFAEDGKGNILMQERTALHLLRTDGTSVFYDSIQGRPIGNCAAATAGPDGQFLVQIDQQVYRMADAGFTPMFSIVIQKCWPSNIFMQRTGMIWWNYEHITIRSFITGKTLLLPFPQKSFKHVSFSSPDDSLYYENKFSGAMEYNLYTGAKRQFLLGKKVSRTFRDATGNVWFTTLGQGLYRLNSDEFRTIPLLSSGKRAAGIWAIDKLCGRLMVGGDNARLCVLDPSDMRQLQVSTNKIASVRVLGYGLTPVGKRFVILDDAVLEILKQIKLINEPHKGAIIGAVKSFARINRDTLLIGGAWGIGIVDLRRFRLTDTLWHDRITTLHYRRDTIYIGTLSGLYAMAMDRSVFFLGKGIPFLKKRISSIAESPDGTLWIASYDGGLSGYRDGKMIATISKRQGLTSDICRTLFVQRANLWVGTDKGLNKVRLDQPDYPVTQYTSQDGLGSNIINCIYADGPVIYVGTDVGLSYFNETKVNLSEGCRLYLLSVLNEGKEKLTDTASLLVPFTDKYLRLEFAGISYRSVGGITYRYRLLGLDSNWRTTKETFLEYLTLPSGKYQLQLRAINKFGAESNQLNLSFRVATPWWETVWFYALIFAATVYLSWQFFSFRIRQIRKRHKEKEKLSQRMMELEHTALQAQMNPHFIFNCLNSIQQYIFDQDIFAANKYITGFSKLIRATLNNSSKTFIPLSDEIDYLTGYLSLEKIRFKEKMHYHVEVDPELHNGHFIIPPMLIQPFVENSMRHGLRHKKEGKGHIHLAFQVKSTKLVVEVLDNGIGRAQAARYKTSEHIEYQSKGMSLTADRIRAINAKHKEPIVIEVVDLVNETGKPAGTRVTMHFPLFHLISENEHL